jgi:hypothetical protein
MSVPILVYSEVLYVFGRFLACCDTMHAVLYAMIAPRCNTKASLCVQQWINFFGAIVASWLAIAA